MNKTTEQFKTFCQSDALQTAAARVVATQAVAEKLAEAVEAYERPIFDRYGFKDEDGEPITDMKHLFVCQDEEATTHYYAECDAAHREHGFTGPLGWSPALVAESNHIDAEYQLLKLFGEFCGVAMQDTCGDLRDRALDLAMKSVINVDGARVDSIGHRLLKKAHHDALHPNPPESSWQAAREEWSRRHPELQPS